MRSVAGFILLASASALAQEVTYEGVYRVYFEVSSFHPNGRQENWWLKGKVPCLDEYVNKDEELDNIPSVYLKVTGSLSAEGHFGHLGAYSHELIVDKVVECRVVAPSGG